MANQRQFVRIETYLSIQYRLLDDESYEEARRRCVEQNAPIDNRRSSSASKDILLENLKNPPSIIPKGMDPLTAKAFNAIDQKLNLILRLIIQNSFLESKQDKYRHVDLSGGGIRVTIPEQLQPGDKVEMEITLPASPPVSMLSVAEVVRIDPVEDKNMTTLYDTAFKFIDIDERNRERIIQYVFKKQRHILRNRTVEGKNKVKN
jgi:hypothetical protein